MKLGSLFGIVVLVGTVAAGCSGSPPTAEDDAFAKQQADAMAKNKGTDKKKNSMLKVDAAGKSTSAAPANAGSQSPAAK